MDFSQYINALNAKLEELGGIGDAKISIDLEPSSSTLVKLSGTVEQPKLLHAEIQKMSEGSLGDERVLNSAKLSDGLKELISKSGSKKSLTVNIAAPGSLVITKNVNYKESMSPLELETYAWGEARKAFPGLLDNLYLDYVPSSENKLLLVAARKKELQERIAALAAAGISVSAVDVDYYALARSYPLIKHQLSEQEKTDHIALINIDSNAIILVVMQNGELLFFHRQTYNGNFLVNMAVEFAETGKCNIFQEMAKESLEAQILRLLQFFQTDFPGRKLSKVILSGQVSFVPGLREIIEIPAKTLTELANPFAGLQMPPSLQESLKSRASAFMISCGLALRGLR